MNGIEYCVFSHIILSRPPPASGSIAIVNWSTVLSRVDFFEVHPRQLVGLLRVLVVGDAPLAGLLVDDELGGAVLVGDGEQRIRAGGERVAADLDRLRGREQGRLVGARAPDLAVGDQPAPDLAGLGGPGFRGVGAPVDELHLVAVDRGRDRLVRADALTLLLLGGLGHRGRRGDERRRDDEGECDSELPHEVPPVVGSLGDRASGQVRHLADEAPRTQ